MGLNVTYFIYNLHFFCTHAFFPSVRIGQQKIQKLLPPASIWQLLNLVANLIYRIKAIYGEVFWYKFPEVCNCFFGLCLSQYFGPLRWKTCFTRQQQNSELNGIISAFRFRLIQSEFWNTLPSFYFYQSRTTSTLKKVDD